MINKSSIRPSVNEGDTEVPVDPLAGKREHPFSRFKTTATDQQTSNLVQRLLHDETFCLEPTVHVFLALLLVPTH